MFIEYIKFDFWFSNQGPSTLLEFFLWSGIFVSTVVLGVFILLYNRFLVRIYPPKNKILKPMGIVLVVSGFSAEFFVLLNWQGIDFLGVRAFEVLFILFILAWLGFFSFKYLKEVPRESVKYEAKQVKKKYI